MARKKATPAEEPEQSGEDAFLEQTGETAEGFALSLIHISEPTRH